MFKSTPSINFASSSVDTVAEGLERYARVVPSTRQVICGESGSGLVVNACNSPDEVNWPQWDRPFLVWLDGPAYRYIAEQVSGWLKGRGFIMQPDQVDDIDVIRVVPKEKESGC